MLNDLPMITPAFDLCSPAPIALPTRRAFLDQAAEMHELLDAATPTLGAELGAIANALDDTALNALAAARAWLADLDTILGAIEADVRQAKRWTS